MSDADLIRAFHEAMLETYRRRLAVSPLLAYSAGAFWLEICEFGGLEAAKRLIHNEEVGVGFVALCQFNRVDLTLEALIHDNPEWHVLFSEDELATCAARLRKYGYHTVGRLSPTGSTPSAKIA
jgi:hypothetical protein